MALEDPGRLHAEAMSLLVEVRRSVRETRDAGRFDQEWGRSAPQQAEAKNAGQPERKSRIRSNLLVPRTKLKFVRLLVQCSRGYRLGFPSASRTPMPNLSPRRQINTETTVGNPIGNDQCGEFANTFRFEARSWDRRYSGPGFLVRGEPSPLYNCHGLTFGSRRTRIWDTEELRKILREDDYIEVDRLNALPGDVLLYLAMDGDIEHSAVVLSRPAESDFGIPLVLSKWGHYKELIHVASRCPYDYQHAKYYRLRSWTGATH